MRRRWWEFRTGHSTYLIFILTFTNFVLISYRLLIEKIPLLKELIPDLWVFSVIFLILYIPTAILIGFWHRKTQLKIETTLQTEENPLLAKMFRTMLDVKTGNISQEEIEKFRKFLTNIEKKFDSEKSD